MRGGVTIGRDRLELADTRRASSETATRVCDRCRQPRRFGFGTDGDGNLIEREIGRCACPAPLTPGAEYLRGILAGQGWRSPALQSEDPESAHRRRAQERRRRRAQDAREAGPVAAAPSPITNGADTMAETTDATRRRNYTDEERERMREWIRKARQESPEATVKELHARALVQLGYPSAKGTFYAWYNEIVADEAWTAVDGRRQEQQPAQNAPVDSDHALDRADADVATLQTAGAGMRPAPRQRREFTIATGYASIEEGPDGAWELRAALTFGDRAEALAHYRRLEQEIADAA